MGGIAGYIGQTTVGSGGVLDCMSSSLRCLADDGVDTWSDTHLRIHRVHHGVLNRERQPIFNESGSICLVMDGEVFDYEENRRQLVDMGHRFRFENNDAEYCLHLYEESGAEGFKDLNGSFCLAVYEIPSKELLLVSDRFCSRPLFYCHRKDGTLGFASQFSSVCQCFDVKWKLDIRSIFEFFTFRRVLGRKTYYRDVLVIPPATVLRYRDGDLSLRPYWEMRYTDGHGKEKDYVNELAAAIQRSVKRRTEGNYRYGLLLSGGLDSRTVLAASDKKMSCFTIGDFRNREVKTAQRIAKIRRCNHVFLERPLNHYPDLIDQGIEISGGMHLFIHAHNLGLFNEIQKDCDVLLHGYLFDVLLKGKGVPENRVSTTNVITKADLMDMPTVSLFKRKPEQLFVEPYSTNFRQSIEQSLEELLHDAAQRNAEKPRRELDYFQFHSAHNCEAYLYTTHIRPHMNERLVALDNELFDLYLEIPLRLRVNGRLFKKAMRKINLRLTLVPDANTRIAPIVPEWVQGGMNRVINISEKLIKLLNLSSPANLTYTNGSWPNWSQLIKHNTKLRNRMRSTLSDPDCLDPSIFNTRKIGKMLEEHLAGEKDHVEFLYLLLNFGGWYKKFGPNSLRRICCAREGCTPTRGEVSSIR
jgi:asparagine synthase (glutamine-hydrolysing)